MEEAQIQTMEEKNPGYKKTKLGWIPEEWDVVKLGEIGKVISGLTYTPNDIRREGLLVLRSSNVQNRRTTFDDNVFVREDIEKYNSVSKGDILICVRNGSKNLIGKSALIQDDIAGSAFGAFMSVYRSKFNDFVFQIFDTDIYHRSIQRNLGATINSINSKDLKRIEIPLPKDKERRKLIELFSSWDSSIIKLDNLVNCKKDIKKGLMQQLLTGKKRLPGFSGKWKEFTYRELLKEVKRDFPWNDNEEYDLISVRRRSGGLFHRDTLYGHQIKTKNLRTAHMGDFLISKMQIVHGASGLTTEKYDGMKISGSYIALVSRDKDTLDINFLNWYSKLPEFYHQCYISSYGVHIEKMTFDFKLFLKEKIRIPELEEQKAIINVLQASQKEIELLKKRKEMLLIQKKGLMQQLLTGKKRIPVL